LFVCAKVSQTNGGQSMRSPYFTHLRLGLSILLLVPIALFSQADVNAKKVTITAPSQANYKATLLNLLVDLADGEITTIAGNGSPGFSGDGGPAKNASLAQPIGITIDASGNLLIADTNNRRIRQVNAITGIINTIAGNGGNKPSGDGGLATQASFSAPVKVAVDRLGNLFISDSFGHLVRRVDAITGVITTVVGNGNGCCIGRDSDKPKEIGLFPNTVRIDKIGNLIISDPSNRIILSVDLNENKVKRVAGGPRDGNFTNNVPATE
jgi:hypothetical protein